MTSVCSTLPYASKAASSLPGASMLQRRTTCEAPLAGVSRNCWIE